MIANVRRRAPLLFSSAVLLTACSTEVIAPTPRLAGLRGVRPSAIQAPALIPNAVKYADAGIRPATGRSGSASLEGRALLGRDGLTRIEVSTGSLEAGTSVGNIDKSQLSVSAGTPVQNFTRLDDGGYWSASYPGLERGTNISVKANVSGIDPNRTDIVEVTTPVALRPDLAVQSMNAPATAFTHDLTTFSAVVSELNGDVGARGNCALSIGGTTVAQATGIWVDAGSMVSCVFTYAFDAAGSYDARIFVDNVNPGDWDTANNSAAFTVTVRDPGEPITTGILNVQEIHILDSTRFDYFFDTFSRSRIEWQHFDITGVQFSGWDFGRVHPVMETVSVTVLVDGVLRRSTTISLTPSPPSGDSQCATYSDGSELVIACSTTWSQFGPYTRYTYEYLTGAVTFFASDLFCTTSGCDVYSSNGGYQVGEGVTWDMQAGSVVDVTLAWTDLAGTAHTVERSGVLAVAPFGAGEQGNCTVEPGVTFCWRQIRTGTYVRALVAW